MTTTWRIGTRGSALALWQANTVKARLEALGVAPCEIVVIKTDGDRLQDAPLSDIGGKRLFVKEIEDALLEGEIDLAVHSAKDMAVVLPAGLHIAGVLPRADPRDAVVLPETRGVSDASLPPPAGGAGHGSAHRHEQRPACGAVAPAVPRRRVPAGARQRRHAAAQAGQRASTTRSCLLPPACIVSTAADASAAACRSMRASRRRARASWPSSAARTPMR